MFGRKLKSLFRTIDVTAPSAQSGFEETRAVDPGPGFEETQMEGDTQFSETQFAPGQVNRYRCTCGQEWEDVFTSACHDTCPSCGKDTAPLPAP